MLRTPLFALLAILKRDEFLDKSQDKHLIKDVIINFLEKDYEEIMNVKNIKDSMYGWRQIISDLTLSNELVDAMSVNLPDLTTKKIPKQDWYTFAGYFPPGYHKILIYDPLMERAFAKEFVVDMSTMDFVYPEIIEDLDMPNLPQ